METEGQTEYTAVKLSLIVNLYNSLMPMIICQAVSFKVWMKTELFLNGKSFVYLSACRTVRARVAICCLSGYTRGVKQCTPFLIQTQEPGNTLFLLANLTVDV